MTNAATLTADSKIVSFDADRAFERTKAVVGKGLRTFVEFDAREYRPLFVSAATRAKCVDDDRMRDHFDRIHRYVHVDLTERDLFEEAVLPSCGRVRSLVTTMDDVVVVRVLEGHEGVFCAMDPGAPVVEVETAIRECIDPPAPV